MAARAIYFGVAGIGKILGSRFSAPCFRAAEQATAPWAAGMRGSVRSNAACARGEVGFSLMDKPLSRGLLLPTIPSNAFAATRGYYSSAGYHQGQPGSSALLRNIVGMCLIGMGAGLCYMAISRPGSSKPEIYVVESPDREEAIDWTKEDYLNGINWVDRGLTPPVVPRNYLKWNCGGCWAIVPAQNGESVVMIETGKYNHLSVQQIIDCCGEAYGCCGGRIEIAFQQMVNYGLTTFDSYPINIRHGQGPCMFAGKKVAVRFSDYDRFFGVEEYKWVKKQHPSSLKALYYLKSLEPPSSYEAVMEVALFKSPISISIYSNDYFRSFRGKGIIEISDCPPPPEGSGTNHAVLLDLELTVRATSSGLYRTIGVLTGVTKDLHDLDVVCWTHEALEASIALWLVALSSRANELPADFIC